MAAGTKTKRGRRTKLTPEVQRTILDAVRQGATLGSAARLAGVARASLFLWLQQFSDFSDALRAAQREASQVAIAANPRPIRRARIELREPPETITRKAYLEVMRICEEGRVPKDLMLEALELAERDLEDGLSEESFTWVDDQLRGRIHGGRRGLGGQN